MPSQALYSWVSWGGSFEVGGRGAVSASVSCLKVSHLGRHSICCLLLCQAGQRTPTSQMQRQLVVDPEGVLLAASV